MNIKEDHFLDKAEDWDKAQKRVQNAQNIANYIVDQIELNGTEHLMDFGAGTGLLSEGIASHVKKITAVDYSSAMLDKLAVKNLPCEVEILRIDLSEAKLDHQFDGIISSMTLHHIEDIPAIFKKFYELLNPGGFVALADLETENGDFHQNNTGVAHYGFDPSSFGDKLKAVGFKKIATKRVHTIQKELESGMKDFPVFLATAYK